MLGLFKKKKIRLDLGCGVVRKKDHIRIDINPEVKPDYCLDLEKDKLPFPDSSVDSVNAFSLLEHIRNLDFLMSEVYRVLKPEGLFQIMVPYFKHSRAFSNPDHIRYFTDDTFYYYSRTCIDWDGSPRKRNCDFEVKYCGKIIDSKIIEKDKEVMKSAKDLEKYWNMFEALNVTLIAKKPMRKINVKNFEVLDVTEEAI